MSARSPSPSARGPDGEPIAVKESDVTESEFSRWKVAVENRMKADELRAERDERAAFRDMQRQQKKDRQERIQSRVKQERAQSREKVEAFRAEKQEAGQAWKDQQVQMRQNKIKEQTAYAEAGYELTRLHGPEQAKRTASRYVELARQKASYGQGGKEDRMALATQRIQQRTARLEEKRQLVEKMKQDEELAPIESKKYVHGLKKQTADGVRADGQKWKEEQQQQIDGFIANAKSNHVKIDATKQKAKIIRQEMQTQHQKDAAKEREAAKQHEASLHDGDNSRLAKVKMNHDMLFAKKFTAEANAELVKKPLADAVAQMRLQTQANSDGEESSRAS